MFQAINKSGIVIMEELQVQQIYKKANFIGVLITTAALYGLLYFFEFIIKPMNDSEAHEAAERFGGVYTPLSEPYSPWLNVIIIPLITYPLAYFLVWQIKQTRFLRWNWLPVSLLGTVLFVVCHTLSKTFSGVSFDGGFGATLQVFLYFWLIFSFPIFLAFIVAFVYEKSYLKKVPLE